MVTDCTPTFKLTNKDGEELNLSYAILLAVNENYYLFWSITNQLKTACGDFYITSTFTPGAFELFTNEDLVRLKPLLKGSYTVLF